MIEPTSKDIGRAVIYRAIIDKIGAYGEEGVITSLNSTFVFVRYGSDKHSKATRCADLAWAHPQQGRVDVK